MPLFPCEPRVSLRASLSALLSSPRSFVSNAFDLLFNSAFDLPGLWHTRQSDSSEFSRSKTLKSALPIRDEATTIHSFKDRQHLVLSKPQILFLSLPYFFKIFLVELSLFDILLILDFSTSKLIIIN